MMRWVLAAGVLAGAMCMPVSMAAESPAPDLAPSAHTARILDSMEARRAVMTPADQKAARALNADGDRHYRKHRYDAAFRSYANSYPNYPTAHAYLMAGDAHWRAVAAHHASLARQRTADGAACSLDNSHFAHDLSMDVAQHQDVGLALAAKENEPRFLQSTLYRRSRESAACLHELAQHYEAEPPSACIDLAKLRSCLGAPLIR